MKKVTYLFLCITFILNLADAQNVSISTEISKNNRLYAGIDNPLKIHAEVEKYDSLNVYSNNGMVYKDDNNFVCIPRRSGRARLQLFGYSDVDTLLLYTGNFLVNSVPSAHLMIGENLIDELNKLSKDTLMQKGEFHLFFNKDITSTNWYEIEDITFGYTIGGFFHRHVNHGSTFTEETMRLINKLNSGTELTIKARIKTEGNVMKTLPLYSLRIY